MPRTRTTSRPAAGTTGRRGGRVAAAAALTAVAAVVALTGCSFQDDICRASTPS
ncbi:hypothetical protein ABZ940_37735 [Streptomyces wuyuanensis]